MKPELYFAIQGAVLATIGVALMADGYVLAGLGMGAVAGLTVLVGLDVVHRRRKREQSPEVLTERQIYANVAVIVADLLHRDYNDPQVKDIAKRLVRDVDGRDAVAVIRRIRDEVNKHYVWRR